MSTRWLGLDTVPVACVAAIRSLSRSPGFSLAVLASLTIGVGANVATFSVLDRVLFQAPPGVRNASAVKRLYIEQPFGSGLSHQTEFSVPAMLELSAAAGELARIEGYEGRLDRAVEGVPGGVTVAYVTGGYFDLLGVRPAAGRFFAPEETRPVDQGPKVAVVSHRLWRTLSGSLSAWNGTRYVRIDSVPHLVVGVAEEDFDGVDLGHVGVWVPLGARPPFDEPLPLLDRSTHSIQLLARQATNVDAVQLAARLTTTYELNNRSDQWIEEFGRIVTAPLLKARGPFLLGLHDRQNMLLAKRLSAVGLVVLLVTMTNVASLLLLRTIRRRHETAVRSALGASAARLRAEVVTETMVLLVTAAVLSALIGWWGGTLLRNNLVFNARWAATPFPERAAMVAALLATVTAIAGTLLPTLGAGRVQALRALRHDTHAGDYLSPRFRAAVLTLQTALGLALLVCGGLFIDSLQRAARIDLGFDADRLVTVDASGRRLAPGSAAEVAAAIARLPGVSTVSNAGSDLSGGQPIIAHPLGSPPRTSTRPAQMTFVDHLYFATTGIVVKSGRGFVPSDLRGADRVAIISESMAAELWPGQEPIGQCLAFGGTYSCIRVVGVAGDVRWGTGSKSTGRYYLPLAQSPWAQGHHFVVRTDGDASGATLAQIQQVVSALASGDPQPPRVQRVGDRLEALTRPWKTAASLFVLYALLTLVSTAMGIYGSIHYDVSQRSRELAIRMALGAQPQQIVRVVVASAGRSLSVGLAIGLVLVIFGGRMIEPLLYGTNRLNPLVLVPSTAILMATAILAAAIPVRKLMRIDPGRTLRSF